MTGYAPVPMRAARDTSLSAPALRLLMAIAFHDRGGVNQRHCFATTKTLALESGIDYRNVARYATELVEAGYIQVEPNAEDKRRRVYSVIADEQAAARADPDVEIVVQPDDNSGEIVVRPESQVIENEGVYSRKKCSETIEKKSRRSVPRGGASPAHPLRAAGPPHGRQDGRAALRPAVQGEMLMPIAVGRGGGRPKAGLSTNQSWAQWMVRIGVAPDIGAAFEAISSELDQIVATTNVDLAEAMRIFDKRMRSRRHRHDHRPPQAVGGIS